MIELKVLFIFEKCFHLRIIETEYAVNVGIPQGSVLLYVADLPTSPESTTSTFADDTAVYPWTVIHPLLHKNCNPKLVPEM
jgi:hypothetical protein